MKFRTDYVTNSSSSSFICDICGHVESGFDLCLSECEMVECVNGHVICRDEMLELPPKEELIKTILENEWNKQWDSQIKDYVPVPLEELEDMDADDLLFNFYGEDEGSHYGMPESVCPICQFIEYSENNLSAYLLKEYGVSRDEVFAEIKQFNKRRKKLYENEYITHVCKKFDLNPTEIVSGWKERFGTYRAFYNYLHNR